MVVSFNGNATIQGLEAALKTLGDAYPSDPRRQRGLIGTGMRVAARKTILPIAKQMAQQGDGSGALSEALTVRQQSNRRLREKNIPVGVEVVPFRFNRKAIALYIQHYYTNQGRTPPAGIVASGIRHGHLVEFGSANNNAQPYLAPARDQGLTSFTNTVAQEIGTAVERRVERERRRNER